MRFLLLIVVFFMFSCKPEASPEEVAEKYCNCIGNNIGRGSDYLIARHRCDSLFIGKYEYFKRFKTQMSLKEYQELSKDRMDSTNNFLDRFMDYMNEYCKYGAW